MYIQKLNLTNFLGLSREIEFTPNFNIIIGVNGVGKTRILNAIRLLLSDLLPRFAAAKIPGRRTSKRSRISANEIYFNSTSLMAELVFKSIDNIDYRYEVIHARAELMEGREKEAMNFADFGRLTPNKTEPYFVEKRKSPNQPLVLYYSAKRIDGKYKTFGYVDQKGEYNNGYFDCLNPDGNMFSGISVWWMNKEAVSAGRQLDAVRNAMKIIFHEILDWFISDHELYFQKIIETRRLNSGTGEWDQQEERVDLRFKDLSHGEQTMALFGLDIARRLAQLNPLEPDPISNGSGIVLIDELDLHLHPKWQRRIVEDLRRTFPKIQFICTTHSPFLIQSLRSGEELIMLDGQPTADLANMSFEEIAQGFMGVLNPEVSLRYEEMKGVAKRYLEILEEADDAPEAKLAEFTERLANAIAPYADNPAFQAFLEMKRAVKLGI